MGISRNKPRGVRETVLVFSCTDESNILLETLMDENLHIFL